MGPLDGRAGVVTGAGSGIGRAAAIRLAADGASVVVSDHPDRRADGAETVARIESAGGTARFIPVDVTHDDHQRTLVETCVESYGGIDFAHNNAGIGMLATNIEDTPREVWDSVIAVNLTGVWLGMKHQVAHMRRQGAGSIVNTASLSGLTGMPQLSAYVASKHGVVGLTKALAYETGGDGIRVNCVCPTAIRTRTMDERGPEKQARWFANNAIKRLGEPEEVAATVAWLISDESSLTTGAAITVDLGADAGFAP